MPASTAFDEIYYWKWLANNNFMSEGGRICQNSTGWKLELTRQLTNENVILWKFVFKFVDCLESNSAGGGKRQVVGDPWPSQCEAWVQMENACNTLNLASILCALHLLLKNEINFALTLWSFTQLESGLNLEDISSCKQLQWILPSKIIKTFLPPSQIPLLESGSQRLWNLFLIYIWMADSLDLHSSHNYSIYRNLFFFRYLQIRNLVQKNMTSFPDLPTANARDILSLSPYRRGLISTIYKNICDIFPQSLQDIRRLWENDIGKEMTDDQWEAVFELIHNSSPCARHSIIQLKIVLREKQIYSQRFPAKIWKDLDPLLSILWCVVGQQKIRWSTF